MSFFLSFVTINALDIRTAKPKSKKQNEVLLSGREEEVLVMVWVRVELKTLALRSAPFSSWSRYLGLPRRRQRINDKGPLF